MRGARQPWRTWRTAGPAPQPDPPLVTWLPAEVISDGTSSPEELTGGPGRRRSSLLHCQACSWAGPGDPPVIDAMLLLKRYMLVLAFLAEPSLFENSAAAVSPYGAATGADGQAQPLMSTEPVSRVARQTPGGNRWQLGMNSLQEQNCCPSGVAGSRLALAAPSAWLNGPSCPSSFAT